MLVLVIPDNRFNGFAGSLSPLTGLAVDLPDPAQVLSTMVLRLRA